MESCSTSFDSHSQGFGCLNIGVHVSRAYSGAVMCCADIKLTADGLKQLRSGHLEALLRDHGLRCTACLDRNDYVQFVLDHLATSEL